MKLLVTGATGHLGAALCLSLVADGHRVIGLARHAPATALAGVTWIMADVDRHDLEWDRLLRDVDVVHHLAWSTVPYSANLDPVADMQSNVAATLRLAEAAARSGTRMVFASSGGTVYGRLDRATANEDHPTRPTSFYGAAKLTAEQYLRLYAQLRGLKVSIMRIANLYGPGQRPGRPFGAIMTFADRVLARDEVVIWGDGEIVRDYVHVADVVSALKIVSDAPTTSTVLNIGSGEGRSLNDIVRLLGGIAGVTVRVRREAARGYDVPVSVLDVARAAAELKWRPRIAFEDGVAQTYVALSRERMGETA